MIFVDIDDCQPDPCMHGGACNDGINSFTCGCAHGFKGDICEISMFYNSIIYQGLIFLSRWINSKDM